MIPGGGVAHGGRDAREVRDGRDAHAGRGEAGPGGVWPDGDEPGRVGPGGDDRGQVGIGLLVMFVAMILVAAIASGVIVNMAGMLGDRAQTAGEDAVGQVTGGVQVQDLTCTVDSTRPGVADAGEPGVEEAWTHVRLRPGGNAVNLSNATVIYTDGQVHGELSYSNETANASHYTVMDDGESARVLTNATRMARITFNVSAIRATELNGTAAPLQNGDEATVTISTPSGAVTKVRIRAAGIAGTESYTKC